MIPTMVERCAGIDIGKKFVMVCVMTGAADAEPAVELRKFGTTNLELERLRVWVVEQRCTHAVMESTGSYWKPVFNVLEDSLAVVLANPSQVKGRKGHKTDWLDCQWLAHLLRHAMVRASYIPPRSVRELRDLTRRRKQVLSDAVSERNRVQKVLEEVNIKLGSVLSDVFGVSGQLILEALLEGRGNIDEIAQLARGAARKKIPQIIEALEGHRLDDHHRTLIRYSLDHLMFLEQQISQLDAAILARAESAEFQEAFQLLQTLPGVQRHSAAVMLAEIGPHVEAFPTAGHLSSWTGVAPGNHASGGKTRPAQAQGGNHWLRSAMVEAAWAAAVKKDCFLHDRFWKLAARGRKKALIAVAHALVVMAWQILSTRQPYREPSADQLSDSRRRKIIYHYIRRLGRLGITVRTPTTVTYDPNRARHCKPTPHAS